MFSKFVMVNSNDTKESAGEGSFTLWVLLALPPLSFFSWYASSDSWRFWYLVGFTSPFFSRYASSNLWKFRVYLPFLQRICFKQLVEVSVLSCSLTSLWPASFLLYACQILWFLSLVSFSLPCLGAFFLLFLALFWVLSFYKVWQGFITIGVSGLYIYIFLNLWICGIFSICDSKEQR